MVGQRVAAAQVFTRTPEEKKANSQCCRVRTEPTVQDTALPSLQDTPATVGVSDSKTGLAVRLPLAG